MKTEFRIILILIMSFLNCSSPKTNNLPMETKKGQVIELASIHLKDGITEDMLLEASQNLQEEFLKKQKGYIKRELVKKSSTEYVDIIYWENQDLAHKAVENAMVSPVCHAFFELMHGANPEDPTGGVVYYEVVADYK